MKTNQATQQPKRDRQLRDVNLGPEGLEELAPELEEGEELADDAEEVDGAEGESEESTPAGGVRIVDPVRIYLREMGGVIANPHSGGV